MKFCRSRARGIIDGEVALLEYVIWGKVFYGLKLCDSFYIPLYRAGFTTTEATTLPPPPYYSSLTKYFFTIIVTTL